MHNVAHTYHPYITERIPQTKFNIKDNTELDSSHTFLLQYDKYITYRRTTLQCTTLLSYFKTSSISFITLHYRKLQIQIQLPIL